MFRASRVAVNLEYVYPGVVGDVDTVNCTAVTAAPGCREEDNGAVAFLRCRGAVLH
jgi:hypothetical protein